MDPVLTENPVPVQTPPQGPAVIVNTEPDKKGPGWKMLLGIGLILLLLFSVLPLGMSAYGMPVPFIPPEVQKGLVMTAYKMPLLPKTPQQILYASANTKQVLTTYKPDFSVSVTVSASGVEAASFDLKIAGPVDITDPANARYDIKADVGANVAGKAYRGSGKVRGVGKMVYIKLDEIPDELKSLLSGDYEWLLTEGKQSPKPLSNEVKKNLDEAMQNWMVYDTSGLETEARKALDEQKRNQADTGVSGKQIQDFMGRQSVIREVKLVGREDVEGVSTYHLKLEPSKEALTGIVMEIMQEEEKDNPDIQKTAREAVDKVDSMVMDFWVGAADSIPRKVTMAAQIDLGSLSEDNMAPELGMLPLEGLASGKMGVSFALVMSDIGKPVVVEAPTPALEPEEYLQKLTDAAKTQEQRDAEARKKQIDEDLIMILSGLMDVNDKTGLYPASLSLVLPGKYEEYTYKQKDKGRGFVVYTEFVPTAGSMFSLSDSNPTLYYGVSSELPYPHQIVQRELD